MNCPFCQAELIDTQPSPKSMRCPNSYRGNNHIFEFLCYGDDINEVHHYTYNAYGWHVDFWPPNPNYPDSKNHVVVRSANDYNKILYSGKTDKDFTDFSKITEYLKLLSVFS